MLAGEHHAPQPGLLDRADDLVGVEIGGVEDLFRLIAVAPFTIGERIDREVEEGVSLQLVPGQLPGGRNRAIGGRRLGRGKQGKAGAESGRKQQVFMRILRGMLERVR